MHTDEGRAPLSGAPLRSGGTPARTRITRPLNPDDLTTPAPPPTVLPPGGSVAPKTLMDEAATSPSSPADPNRITRRFGTAELGRERNLPSALRPVHVIIEPSYMPMAPGRPDTLEAFLPRGVIDLRPWRGTGRQMRLPEAEALRLHKLALQALEVPTGGRQRGALDVIPMTVILRYEGYAHRWTITRPDRTPLDALVTALTTLAGTDTGYG